MTVSERKEPIGSWDWGDMTKYLPERAVKREGQSHYAMESAAPVHYYAVISSFKALQHAIEHGSAHRVTMPVNLEQDCMTPGQDGLLNTHVAAEKLGGVSCAWTAIDHKRKWIGTHDLPGPGITWIDYAYYRENAGVGVLALDDFERAVALLVYNRWRFESNVTATLTIRSAGKPDKKGQAPMTVMLENFRGYEVSATYGSITQTIRIGCGGEVSGPAAVETDPVSNTVRFVFTPVPTLLGRIRACIFPPKFKPHKFEPPRFESSVCSLGKEVRLLKSTSPETGGYCNLRCKAPHCLYYPLPVPGFSPPI